MSFKLVQASFLLTGFLPGNQHVPLGPGTLMAASSILVHWVVGHLFIADVFADAEEGFVFVVKAGKSTDQICCFIFPH